MVVDAVEGVVLTVQFGVGVDVVREAGVVVLRQVGQRHVEIGGVDEVLRGGVEAGWVELVDDAVGVLEEAGGGRLRLRAASRFWQ